ncbi:MAG: (d)CMP kinase [Patescibacteria group bacterium]
MQKIKFESSARDIAIDGPAGVGKTTLGNEMAKCIDGGFHVDTGSLHRIVTAFGLWKQLSPEQLAQKTDLLLEDFGQLGLQQLSGHDHPSWIPEQFHIRSADVNTHVPYYANDPVLRPLVGEETDRIALDNADRCLIYNGRGEYQRIIASELSSHLLLGLYLSLGAHERARRRALEILGREPTEDETTYEVVRLEHRDEGDAANLVKDPDCQDALIDDFLNGTSNWTPSELIGCPQLDLGMEGFDVVDVPVFTRNLLSRHVKVTLLN